MPNQDAVDRFLTTHGERAKRVITVLAKQAKFKEAIESEVGQALMADVVESMESLLEKIINDTASPEEKAEFRAFRLIADKWQAKLSAYTRAVMQIATNKI